VVQQVDAEFLEEGADTVSVDDFHLEGQQWVPSAPVAADPAQTLTPPPASARHDDGTLCPFALPIRPGVADPPPEDEHGNRPDSCGWCVQAPTTTGWVRCVQVRCPVHGSQPTTTAGFDGGPGGPPGSATGAAMSDVEHVLKVRSDSRPAGTDRARLWLYCPAGDLTVHVTIGPAVQAAYLIEALTAAHRAEVMIRDGGGDAS
jgi:hypothetical protein